MKKFTMLSILAIVMAMNVNAKVWRVNNRPNMDPDFTTLQAAIDSAAWGDTLHIEPSPTSYGNGTFAKKLTVIGAGYWHAENDSTQFYREESEVAILTFNAGSQGSSVSGLYVYGGNFGSQQNWKLIAINTDSITIQRNRIYGFVEEYYTYSGFTIHINGNYSGIIIEQNWIESRIYDTNSYGVGNGTICGIYHSGITNNTIIRNNFIRSSTATSWGGYRSIQCTQNNSTSNLFISNNVIWGPIITYYTNHVNNILLEGTYNVGTGDITNNNLCNATQYPITGQYNLNNKQNVTMDSVFVNSTKYVDNGYFLKEGSPAIGAGLYGGDCGVFGQDSFSNPYVLSGISAIPAIFDVAVKPMGVSTIPVTIKAKSNN